MDTMQASSNKYDRRGGVTKPQFVLEVQNEEAAACMKGRRGGETKPQSVLEVPKQAAATNDSVRRIGMTETQTGFEVQMQAIEQNRILIDMGCSKMGRLQMTANTIHATRLLKSGSVIKLGRLPIPKAKQQP